MHLQKSIFREHFDKRRTYSSFYKTVFNSITLHRYFRIRLLQMCRICVLYSLRKCMSEGSRMVLNRNTEYILSYM